MDRPERQVFSALQTICRRLKDHDIKWTLVGSASLVLQGVAIQPQDIDILTDKEGAYEVNKVFKEFEVRAVAFSQSEHFASHFWEFRIKGVKVDVMGDLKEHINGQWQRFPLRPRIIRVENMSLPVTPLETELDSYKLLGREKDALKVAKIEAALSRPTKR